MQEVLGFVKNNSRIINTHWMEWKMNGWNKRLFLSAGMLVLPIDEE
jgi:hypothetical protein